MSVVVPSIPPRTKLLKRALLSVWGQTRDPDAVIVAMDREGEGAGPTRTRAAFMADTEWVATLDDDDAFEAHHLESLLRTAQETGADAVYSWFRLDGWAEATPERPDPLAVPVNGQLVHPLGVPFGPEQAEHMRRHAFIPVTGLYRTELLRALGGWPTPGSAEWPREDCEDHGLWLKLLNAGAKIVHCAERSWICAHHAGSTAGRPWRERTAAR